MSMTTSSKRTRLNVRQSKFGCFTCKSRRIKCDEEKPSCFRCSRAGRVCGGYPEGAPVQVPSRTQSSISVLSTNEDMGSALAMNRNRIPYALNTSERKHPTTQHFAELGRAVLADDPFRSKASLENGFWYHLLPQLSAAIPSVHAALAAFGACYEWQKLANQSHNAVAAVKQYNIALQAVRQDLQCLPYGIIPMIMACVLLACTETLGRCHMDAATHLKGACELFIHQLHRKNPKLIYTLHESQKDSTDYLKMGGDDDDDDGISTLLRRLDLQSLTYGLGRPPMLPVTSDFAVTDFVDLEDAAGKLSKCQHACHAFCARATKYKYKPLEVSQDLWTEQGRQIAVLRTWLTSLDKFLSRFQSIDNLELPAQAHVLKAQCLSTIIYASVILHPRESAWDAYEQEFLWIVECGERLLDYQDLSSKSNQPVSRFSPNLGIIQPLFLTAIKCRVRQIRLRALGILQGTGTEGPWSGEVESAMAKRIIEIEENGFPGAEETTIASDERVKERYRVCGSSIFEESPSPTEPRRARIELWRCRDIDLMTSIGNTSEEPIHWDKMSETLYIA